MSTKFRIFVKNRGFSVGTINYLHQFYFIAKDIMENDVAIYTEVYVKGALGFGEMQKTNKPTSQYHNNLVNRNSVIKSASCYYNFNVVRCSVSGCCSPSSSLLLLLPSPLPSSLSSFECKVKKSFTLNLTFICYEILVQGLLFFASVCVFVSLCVVAYILYQIFMKVFQSDMDP